jgi:hypothetical protein
MALSQEQQKQFIKDYKSGVKVSELTKKYKVSNDAYTYNMIYNLRKLNLIPAAKKSSVDHAERMKKAWETRKANKANMIKTTDNVTTEVTNKPVTDYRTVYFKDFSVQIHKKAMARLVVDHNNNLHILNN